MGKGRIRNAVVSRVRKGTDFERTLERGRSLKDYIRRLFIPQRAKYKETLTEAMQRFQLSQADIDSRMRILKRITVIMLLTAASVFFYAIYLLVQQNWYAGVFSVVIMGLPLVLAFRYHFWYFQLKQGKLGCTLREWFTQGLLGR